MPPDHNDERKDEHNEEHLLRSVTLQNARAILLAREQAERELIAAKEALELKSAELRESNQFLLEARDHLEKRVQERTAQLHAANDNLRQLSAELLQARDDEQRRLARELHDSVGQLLVGIAMNISVVQTETHKLSPAAAKCVSDNAHLLDQVSKEIRTMSYLLHPPLLDEAGLGAALDWYAEGFAERSQIKVDLNLAADLSRLPGDAEIAIFRIIQQCLTNIHRHSGSATASIRIYRQGDQIIVEVVDSGKGIPQEKIREITDSGRTGVGFAGMRERLRQLGGTLNIESDGNGTLVRASLRVG